MFQADILDQFISNSNMRKGMMADDERRQSIRRLVLRSNSWTHGDIEVEFINITHG